MGKFPGKPSKFVNKKRIQVAKCGSEKDNNSAKNAENIYNGLAVFYEVFGSDEQVNEDFHGFTPGEVKEAEDFISALNKTRVCKGRKVSRKNCVTADGDQRVEDNSRASVRQNRKQCFDGGGTEHKAVSPKFKKVKCASISSSALSLNRTFKHDVAKRILNKAKKASHSVSNLTQQDKTNPFAPRKFVLPSRSAHSSRVIKPNKRFLEGEEVFSDVGVDEAGADPKLKKPKLVFQPDDDASEAARGVGESSCVPAVASAAPKPEATPPEPQVARSSMSCKLRFIGVKEFGRGVASWPRVGADGDGFKWTGGSFSQPSKSDPERKTFSSGAAPATSPASSSGSSKVILRKARLKLDSRVSRSESSFATFSTSNGATTPGTVQCSVCGAVRFYRFVKQARKFGVLCCESCRKFVSKMIRLLPGGELGQQRTQLECHNGNGMCRVPSVVRNQQWRTSNTLEWCAYNARCPACWLQMCLRAFTMPPALQRQLRRMLPPDMREVRAPGQPPPATARDLPTQARSKRKAALASLKKMVIQREDTAEEDFRTDKKLQPEKKYVNKKLLADIKLKVEKKLNVAKKKVQVEKGPLTERAPLDKRAQAEKKLQLEKRLKPKKKNEQNKIDRKNNTQLNHLATTKILKKAAKNLVKVKGDKKEAGEERRRQQLELKGPRVKHVCRSASIVLGQPQATFPLHSRPDKKKLTRLPPGVGMPVFSDAGKVSKNKPWGSKHAPLEEDAAARANSTDKCATDVRGPKAQRGSQEAPAQPRESGECGPGDSAPPPNSRKAAKLPVASILPPVARILPLSSGGGGANSQHLICVDFWESYDPEEVCNTGFALIGSEPFHVRAVCFLCGSAGHEKLIHCASCCEPYHMFCVEEGATGVAWPHSWTCKRCTVCQGCGRGSGQQVNCQRCHRSYHSECLGSDRSSSRLHSPDRPWVCAACLRCKSCGKPDVTVFVGNLPLCKACFKLRKKGNFCPLCQRCYEDNDFDTKMMECGQCRCWVHAKCEGLSDEKYQVLSYLPESVEFVCRLCSATPPAPWWRAVEEEMKAGYLAVLRGLSKNRKACALFKWSPKKRCTFHTKRIDSQDGAELSDSSLDDVGSTEGRPLDQKGEDDPGTTSNSDGTSSAPGSGSLVARDVRMIPSEQNLPIGAVGRSLVNLRQRFNIKECRVQINYPRPQASLSVPIPAIGRSSETRVDCTFRGCSSPSKIPAVPMATPPSDSGLGSTDDELKPSLSTEEDPEDATFLSGVPALSRSRTTEACVEGTTVEPEEVPESKRCRCQELQLNANLSSTLLAIKKSVASNDYFSLLKFHEDMEQLVSSTNCPDLLDTYHNALREVFPWFDPKSAKVSEKPIINSSSKVDRQESELVEGDESNPKQADLFVLPEGSEDYYYSGYTVKDVRTCVFCKGVGDGLPTLEGRLLYCGQNEWTHANCALWSAEVFEEIDGSLQNVHVAMSRGRMIRCRLCRKKGASVGCCYRNCIETYHFPCAMKAKCAFMDDKSVYCSAHNEEAIVGKQMALTSDFDLPRSIYVELDRKKKKYVESQQVRIMIGSLVVENIGDFVPSVSDQKDFIIPMNYSCSRLYWSAVEPWRIVRYNVKVTLKTTVFQPAQDLGQNVTVDHTQGAQLVQQKIADILRWQQQVLQFDEHKLFLPKLKSASVQTDPCNKKIPAETKVARQILDHLLEVVCKDVDDNCLTDPQNTADLLPPELKDAIFEDLPHDLIDGISMQDIFPKLMNSYEDSVALDLKADIYYGAESLKEGKEDLCEEALMDSEVEPVVANVFPNNKRLETMTELGSQTDLWFQNNEAKDSVEERFAKRKDLRRSKSEGIPNSGRHHRSCSLLWNCKLDGSGKRKPSHRASLDDATYVAAEVQRLQECHRELRYRLEGEEGIVAARRKDHGKENKFLPWHGRPLSRIPQLDGAADSSSSGSESESPPHEGTADVVRQRSAYAPATTDDEPVTCSRCHRTYRTINSFERHLSTCNNDLILSTSDSDSENPKSCEEDCGNNRASRDSPQSQARLEDKSPVAPVEEEIVEVRVPSPPPPVPETVPEPVVKLPAIVSSPPRPSPPPARVVGRTGRPRGRPSKQRLLAMQQEMMVHTPVQQPQTLLQPPPSVIMQQVQSPNMMASFVDSFQQQTGHNLQYIATIDSHKPPQYITTLDGYVGLPAAGIPMMPQAAVLGTLIQPQCGVMTTEQMVLGPPGGMILGQPVYYGLETIVSNTVMQSSQFVSATMPGMIAASSSFSTTTQVFQASKIEPVLDVPAGFVIVNPHAPLADTSSPMQVVAPPAPPQPPPAPGPWRYNGMLETPAPPPLVRPTYRQCCNNCDMPMQPERPVLVPTSAPMPVTSHATQFTSTACQTSAPTIAPSVPSAPCPRPAPALTTTTTTKTTTSPTPTPSSLQEPIKVLEKITIGEVVRGDQQITLDPSKAQERELVASPLQKLQEADRIDENVAKSSSEVVQTVSVNSSTCSESSTEGTAKKAAKVKPFISVAAEKPKSNMNRVEVPVCSPMSDTVERMQSLEDERGNGKVASREGKEAPADFFPNVNYEIHTEDGFVYKSSSLSDVCKRVFEAVQEARRKHRMAPLPNGPFQSPRNGLQLLGLNHNSVTFVIEQLQGTARCVKYRSRYHKLRPPLLSEDDANCVPLENPSGCARAETFKLRSPYDMFGWLASRHRRPPKLYSPADGESLVMGNRRATSSNLPMAMRFRHLKETSKEAVGVYRSHIHGRGLFCLRDIELGEMVIEYAGEVIRSTLTDKREKYYESKDIGCYMFRIDDHLVVDATMRGNAARFINHSCEPNCYSRVVDILGKKHILIFALRRILQGEELTYDYKFPFEDVKIPCTCGSRKCRKYLN